MLDRQRRIRVKLPGLPVRADQRTQRLPRQPGPLPHQVAVELAAARLLQRLLCPELLVLRLHVRAKVRCGRIQRLFGGPLHRFARGRGAGVQPLQKGMIGLALAVAHAVLVVQGCKRINPRMEVPRLRHIGKNLRQVLEVWPRRQAQKIPDPVRVAADQHLTKLVVALAQQDRQAVQTVFIAQPVGDAANQVAQVVVAQVIQGHRKALRLGADQVGLILSVDQQRQHPAIADSAVLRVGGLEGCKIKVIVHHHVDVSKTVLVAVSRDHGGADRLAGPDLPQQLRTEARIHGAVHAGGLKPKCPSTHGGQSRRSGAGGAVGLRASASPISCTSPAR